MNKDSFIKNQDELQTQEIIKLRLQLISTKRKVDAYQKLNNKIQNYQKIIQQIIEQFNKHKLLIAQICQIMELDRSIKQKVIKKYDKVYPQEKKNQKQKDPFDENIRKMNERLQQFSFQTVLLQHIKTNISNKYQQYKKLTQEYKVILQKQDNSIDISSFNQNKIKLQQLQREIQQKDSKINTLQAYKMELSSKMELMNKELKQQKLNANLINQNLLQRQQQLQKLRYAQIQLQDYHGQKQKVKNNCHRLMQTLKINDDDYLKCYLRSNGVPLDTHRSQKNKYFKVFDL